jgi:hypothetical protein
MPTASTVRPNPGVEKLVAVLLGVPIVLLVNSSTMIVRSVAYRRLPATSPANASMSYDVKLRAWSSVLPLTVKRSSTLPRVAFE